MANYNKIILVGNLTRDPQLSYLPNQTPACEIGLAVNHRYKGSDGQQREDTCFIDCRCYGRQAEILNQYMSKGRQLLVEGRLQYATWEAQDGSKRSKHRVLIDRFQFLDSGGQGGGPGGGQGGGGYNNRPAPQQRSQRQGPPPQQHPNYDEPPPQPDEGDFGEDIPF